MSNIIPPEYRDVCEIMWEKYGRAGRATVGNIIRRMRFTCRKTKATYTHPEYVILISIPLQLWLRERASVQRLYYLRYGCV